MASKVKATARIRCEVEIEVGTWDGSGTFDQLHDQVLGEGVAALSNMESRSGARLKIVGTPVVVMVTTERAK
jgi:hypothetical protein